MSIPSLIPGAISEDQRDMNVKYLSKAGKIIYKVLGMDMDIDGTDIYSAMLLFFNALVLRI